MRRDQKPLVSAPGLFQLKSGGHVGAVFRKHCRQIAAL